MRHNIPTIKNNTSRQMFLQPGTEAWSSKFVYIKFFCSFETVTLNSVSYVVAFSIVGPKVFISKSLKPTVLSKIKVDSFLFILDFMKTCYNLISTIKVKAFQKFVFLFHQLEIFILDFILSAIESSHDFCVSVVKRNNIVYNMTISNLLQKYILHFHDSYGLLNFSLKKINTIFCKLYKNTFFNISLLNKFLYLTNSNKQTQLSILKVESFSLIKSLTLADGFKNFIYFFQKFLAINPLMAPSLPTLAFKIFLKKYYKLAEIENCSSEKDHFIRRSYHASYREVYKPFMQNGYNYDVNSLYPFAMQDCFYPLGTGRWLSSPEDLKNIVLDESFFGFAQVIVTCPKIITIPLLTTHHPVSGELISPVGCWEDVYFSEELKAAKALGYSFIIIKAYQYECKGKILSSFATALHDVRRHFPNKLPKNKIIKSVLNFFTGRVGLNPRSLTNTALLTFSELQKLLLHYNPISISFAGEGKFIITHELKISELRQNLVRSYSAVEESFAPFSTSTVQIAAAIASYGRVFLHKYKLDPMNIIYYSDTDSFFCKYPLRSNNVSGSKLGFLKRNATIKEAYFLSSTKYAYLSCTPLGKIKGGQSKLIGFNSMKQLYHMDTNFSFSIDRFPFLENLKNFFPEYTFYSRSPVTFLGTRLKIYNHKGVWVDTKPLVLPLF